MSRYRESNKKRSGGNLSIRQNSKWQSFRSSSENSSNPRRSIRNQGSSRSDEVPTCPSCQKKHWGECRIGSKAFYWCGQEGHRIKECPQKNRAQGTRTYASASIQQSLVGRQDNQPRQDRAFAFVPRNSPATPS